jgi:hypothetical protein
VDGYDDESRLSDPFLLVLVLMLYECFDFPFPFVLLLLEDLDCMKDGFTVTVGANVIGALVVGCGGERIGVLVRLGDLEEPFLLLDSGTLNMLKRNSCSRLLRAGGARTYSRVISSVKPIRPFRSRRPYRSRLRFESIDQLLLDGVAAASSFTPNAAVVAAQPTSKILTRIRMGLFICSLVRL